MVVRSRVIGAAVGAAALMMISGWARTATGEEPSEAAECPVVASAQGLQLMVSKTGDLVFDEPTGAAVPAAQACVNYSVTDSTAFASDAYPGATAMTLPGVVASTAGAQAPAPDYPGYVSSSYPTNGKADYDQSAVVLHASSTQTSSKANAQVSPPSGGAGAGSTGAQAESTVDPASRSAVARAASAIAPMTINGAVSLGEVHSTAEARIGGDGRTVQRKSSLEIGRTTVAGEVVTITPQGVQVATQTLPGVPGPDVSDVLKQAGVEVTYLAAQKTPSGILSPGLRIRAESQDPSGAVTTVDYVLGRSFAAVSPVHSPESAAQPSSASPDSGHGPAQAPPRGAGVASASGPPASSAVPAGTAPQGAPAGAADTPLSLAGAHIDLGLDLFYVVLVIGGAVMFVSSTLVRLLGVRTRWIS